MSEFPTEGGDVYVHLSHVKALEDQGLSREDANALAYLRYLEPKGILSHTDQMRKEELEAKLADSQKSRNK